MTVYAANTSVSVGRSIAEIQDCLSRYGADKFAQYTESGLAGIIFEFQNRQVKFELPLPKREDFAKKKVNTGYGHYRVRNCSPEEQAKLHEQACRQKWRALALVIKAKLEAVESGITSFQDEFLAHTVLPNGKTLGSWIAPQLADAFTLKKMPPMLGDGR